jgi:hypothetical protein
MFQRLTNVRLLCNVRRKATITWALAQPDMDRESLARLCRHTLRVYDQRSNDVRTVPALEAIESLATALGKKREDEPEVKAKIGDVIRYQSSCGRKIGKVIDVLLMSGRQEVTMMLMMVEKRDGEATFFYQSR